MSTWTAGELATIVAADELELASIRRDGTLRKPVTIWVVRDGDDLYVRAFKGRMSPWFRGALERREGRIRAGGVERNVAFADADASVHPALDAAYREKYRRFGARYVDPMVEPDARAATLKLLPMD
jgi:hypothetical protein